MDTAISGTLIKRWEVLFLSSGNETAKRDQSPERFDDRDGIYLYGAAIDEPCRRAVVTGASSAASSDRSSRTQNRQRLSVFRQG